LIASRTEISRGAPYGLSFDGDRRTYDQPDLRIEEVMAAGSPALVEAFCKRRAATAFSARAARRQTKGLGKARVLPILCFGAEVSHAEDPRPKSRRRLDR
jgi:hypothetical protein